MGTVKECLNCKHFVADDPNTPEEELACLKDRPDFRKQLISGQTTDCSDWAQTVANNFV